MAYNPEEFCAPGREDNTSPHASFRDVAVVDRSPKCTDPTIASVAAKAVNESLLVDLDDAELLCNNTTPELLRTHRTLLGLVREQTKRIAELEQTLRAAQVIARDSQRLYDELEICRETVEQQRVQLAGVSVAAMGGVDENQVAKPDDYGWSQPYQDTLELRCKYDASKLHVRELEGCVTELERRTDEVLNTRARQMAILLNTQELIAARAVVEYMRGHSLHTHAVDAHLVALLAAYDSQTKHREGK